MNQQLESILSELIVAFGRGLARAWKLDTVAAPSAPARAPARRGRRPRAAPVAEKPAQVQISAKPRAGHEVVTYRQGRGSFEARIVRFDSATKMLTLERLSDGKRVVRPASKVYSGS